MGDLLRVDFRARARRAVRLPSARTCERCPDPSYEANLCAWHFALVAAEQADHRARMDAELLSGERCALCRLPIRPRSLRAVLQTGGALHEHCAVGAIAREAERAGEHSHG